jgi:hypothetical protein
MLNLPFLGFAQDSSDLASEALALQRMIHSGQQNVVGRALRLPHSS